MVRHIVLLSYITITLQAMNHDIHKNHQPPKPLEILISQRHFDVLFPHQQQSMIYQKKDEFRSFCYQGLHIEIEEQVARYILERTLYETLMTIKNSP